MNINILKLSINFIGRIYSFFKRCNNVIYISSNVKILNKNDIAHKISKYNDITYIEHNRTNCNKLRKYKIFHFFQRICLQPIILKMKKCKNIIYCGYSSQMFSIYDGYILNNISKYEFLEYNNKDYYLINYKNEKKESCIEIDYSKNEINLIIQTSYDINIEDCVDVPSVIYKKKADIIDCNYLNDVYNFVKNTLDSCCKSKNGQKIDRVNIYITAKPSVSFIVGTAIQSYHPNVYVYEYRDNHFKYCFDLKRNKIMEI